MARSIIDVDINDDKFKAFLTLFKQFESAVKKQPAAWNAINQASDKVGKSLTDQADDAEKIGDNLSDAATAQTKINNAAAKTNREFSGVAKSAKSIAGSIKDATFWILKWSAITTAVGGLLGAGGLFGIDRMAVGAGNTRRTSMGLGISAGELNALKTNYGGKGIDVESMLEKINEARNDPSQKWLFGANHISDYQHKDNAQILQELIPNLKSGFGRSGGNAAAIPGLTAFADINTLTMLSKMSDEEIKSMGARAEADKKALAVSDKTLQAWQSFTTQLDRAGTQIHNVFVNGLLKLQNPLEHLSAAFVNLVQNIVGGDGSKKLVNGLAGGIDKFAKFVNTPEFQSDVNRAINVMSALTIGIFRLSETIAHWLGTSSASPGASGAYGNSGSDEFGTNNKALFDRFSAYEAAHSGDATNSGKSALFNMLGATRPALYNLGNKYNGDMAKAIAAYKNSDEAVDDAVQKYGTAWLAHMPQATQNEVRIVVTNATGGNAVVNANQSGQQN